MAYPASSPVVLNPKVQVPSSRTGNRIVRRPRTDFNLIFKPFQLQPCAIFPVLPGETLKNLMFQTQLWSDPLNVNGKNTPWHFEYYTFYVKFRDLPGYQTGEDGLGKDLIDAFENNESLAPHQEPSVRQATYCPVGGIDYTLNCVQRIAECYFREDGEQWGEAADGGLPLVKLFGRGHRDVHDKLTMEGATAATDQRQSLDWDQSGTITVDDIPLAYQEWVAQRDGPELDMDYEDMVRAAGGKVTISHEDKEQYHEPEDIGHFREFTYPVNTVEPTTGAPSVAVGWRLTKQSKKMIRFDEFGWVICLVVVRPKFLLKNQKGSYASMMQTRSQWLPPNLDVRSYAGDLTFQETTGPLAAVMTPGAKDYQISLRDLLMYGEQFVNHDGSAMYGSALPSAAGKRFYPTASEIMAPFADTVAGRLRADGVINLSISTHQAVKDVREAMVLRKW